MSSPKNSPPTWAQFVWPWPCTPPSPFELSPVPQVDQAVIDPEIERRLDFVHMFDDPALDGNKPELSYEHPGEILYPPGLHMNGIPCWNVAPGPKPKAELVHPRPVRKIALRDAMARFEDMANDSDVEMASDSSSDGYVTCPSSPQDNKALEDEVPDKVRGPAYELDRRYPDLRRQCKANAVGINPPSHFAPNPAPVFTRDRTSAVFTRARPSGTVFTRPRPSGAVFTLPRPSGTVFTPDRPSGGLACLSPGFVDNVKGSERSHPPRPNFVLKKTAAPGPICRPSPIRGSPPRESPDRPDSSSPEATYVRGHHIARLIREYGDIFVEREDGVFTPDDDSDDSWFNDEEDISVLAEFQAAYANGTISSDGDGSFSFHLDTSMIAKDTAEDSYLADEESNSSESPCVSPIFSPIPSPASSDDEDSFIFTGPTVRLVQPSNIPSPELPNLPGRPLGAYDGFFWSDEDARPITPIEEDAA